MDAALGSCGGGAGGESEVCDALSLALHALHSLECTVSQDEPPSGLLLSRLDNAWQALWDVRSAASSVANTHIPLEVLRSIDEGRNPEEYTRSQLLACVEHNAATRGKVEALSTLRQSLLGELQGTFPAEVAAYKRLRLKALQQPQASAQHAEDGAKAGADPQAPPRDVRGGTGETADLDSTPTGQPGVKSLREGKKRGREGEVEDVDDAEAGAGVRPGDGAPSAGLQVSSSAPQGKRRRVVDAPSLAPGEAETQSESGSDSESGSEREGNGAGSGRPRRGLTALDLNGAGEGEGGETGDGATPSFPHGLNAPHSGLAKRGEAGDDADVDVDEHVEG